MNGSNKNWKAGCSKCTMNSRILSGSSFSGMVMFPYYKNNMFKWRSPSNARDDVDLESVASKRVE